MTASPDVIALEAWSGPWEPDDANANFKAEVALYALQDPMPTLAAMGEAMDIPVGALARYVLARYATYGSGGLLELGPVLVHRLWEPIAKAEEQGTQEERLRAYEQLREMISWLRLPLVEDGGYR